MNASENYDPKAYLLFALNHFGLEVINESGKMVLLQEEYMIEVEKIGLYKLIHQNQVVAPFSDVEALCQFIKMDKELNAKN